MRQRKQATAPVAFKKPSSVASQSVQNAEEVPVVLIGLLSAIVGAFCFANAAHGSFVFDDNQAVIKNPDVCSTSSLNETIWDMFRHDFWGMPMASSRSHKSYRPLTVLTFHVNCKLGGLEPAGFRAVNVLCHGLCCMLLVVWCARMRMSRFAVACTGLLFAVHPVHSEAVCNVVGRADLLSGVFFFSTLIMYSYCYSRDSSSIASAFCFVTSLLLGNNGLCFKSFHSFPSLLTGTMAMLCKETGVTVFAVCGALDAAQSIGCFHPVQLLLALLFGSTGSGSSNDTIRSSSMQDSKGKVKSESSTTASPPRPSLLPLRVRLVCLSTSVLLLLYCRYSLNGGTPPAFSSGSNPAAESGSTLVSRRITEQMDRLQMNKMDKFIPLPHLSLPDYLICLWFVTEPTRYAF